MGQRSRLLGVGSVLVLGLANAQPLDLGRTLSIELLQRLAHPALDGTDVVVIHAEVGSAIVINRRVARDRVVYVRGNTFLWAQIAEQLPSRSVTGQPMHLEVRRWTLDTASCPLGGEKVAAFLRQLDTTDFHRNGASTEQQEIFVDAATFLIQMVANDALVTITPNGALDPPLQRAASELHSAVSRCAAAEVPTVEQHDF